MLLIQDKPFLTLDEFIDIKTFLSLEDEFNFMISSTCEQQRTGIWSAGGHSPDFSNAFHREKDLLYYVHHAAQKERKQNEDLDLKLKHFENKNDKTGLARFYKLKYKAMDPYVLLNLRTTTKNVYASDAHFTEEDWNTYKWTDTIERFPKIKEWVESLPLERLGIMTVFFNDHYVPLAYHRDLNYFPLEKGNNPDPFPHRQEFIWFRFNLDRELYLFDIIDGKIDSETKIEGYSAFWNHHQWHGNFNPIPFASITVKVEGKFSEELRENLGISDLNYYR